jgi:hypothetical protein
MMSNKVIMYYWITFLVSIFILILNTGLWLIVSGLIILPVIILHIIVGLRLNMFETYEKPMLISSTFLLIFALIRPDGVHSFNNSGLSSFLRLFGLSWGYSNRFEDYFFVSSIILLLLQLLIEITLIRLKSEV